MRGKTERIKSQQDVIKRRERDGFKEKSSRIENNKKNQTYPQRDCIDHPSLLRKKNLQIDMLITEHRAVLKYLYKGFVATNSSCISNSIELFQRVLIF